MGIKRSVAANSSNVAPLGTHHDDGLWFDSIIGVCDYHKVEALCQHSPWRRENPVTAGQIRKGLQLNFRHVNVRAWWNRKCKKFEPPNWRGSEKNEHEMLNA